MDWLAYILYLLSALAIGVTALPLWGTTRWWVRIWDFPRFQVALLCVAVLLAWIFARPTGAAWILIGILAAALAWQMSWIWRYLPGAPCEVRNAKAQPSESNSIAVLTTNVLQSNREVGRLIQIIFNAQPDVVLAVETDEWWCSELAGALSDRYCHAVRYPLSNGYGLTLLSKLELVHPEVRFVIDEAIPSLRAEVRLRNGQTVDLYCVHPQPPAPRQDSTERDCELLIVAQEIWERGRPAILVGDLNDVAWSRSTLQFSRVGALLDPRRGRGFYNTYPAQFPGFRYPLDYVFATRHFDVCRMQVLPRFGSDHLPLLAEFELNAES